MPMSNRICSGWKSPSPIDPPGTPPMQPSVTLTPNWILG